MTHHPTTALLAILSVQLIVPGLCAGEAQPLSTAPAVITGPADRVEEYRLAGEVPLVAGPAVLRVYLRGETVENAWIRADAPDGVVIHESVFNDGVRVRGQDPARLPPPAYPELAIAGGNLRGKLGTVNDRCHFVASITVEIDRASGKGSWQGGNARGDITGGAIDPAKAALAEDPLRPGFGWPRYRGPNGLGAAVPIDRPVVEGLGQARFVWKSQERWPLHYCGGSSPVADGDLVVMNYYQPAGTVAYASGGRKFSLGEPKQAVGYDWRSRALVQADDVIVGIDARSGLTRWRTVLPLRAINWQNDQKSMPGSACAIADGRVFAAGYCGQIYALDASSGKPLWEADLGAASAVYRAQAAAMLASKDSIGPKKPGKRFGHSDGPPLARPIVVDGVALFNAGTREVHAFDAVTGQRLWQDLDAHLGWRGFIRTTRLGDGPERLAYIRARGNQPALLVLVEPRSGKAVFEAPLPFAADPINTWHLWRDLLVLVPRFAPGTDESAKAPVTVQAWRIAGQQLEPTWSLTPEGNQGSRSLPVIEGGILLFGGQRSTKVSAINIADGTFLGHIASPNGQDSYYELDAAWGLVIRPSFSLATMALQPGGSPAMIETSAFLEYGYDSAMMDIALADGRIFFRSGGGLVCMDMRAKR